MCTDGLLIAWHSELQQPNELIGKIDIVGLDSFKPNQDNLYLIEDAHPFGKAFMKFTDQKSEIFFQESMSKEYYFISDSFSSYFRLSFSCLLTRGWQTGFGSGITKWTNDWMCFYCPKIIDMIDKRVSGQEDEEFHLEKEDQGNGFCLEKIIQYIKE
jgi:hypothetical protein